jgi:hypothetical protein
VLRGAFAFDAVTYPVMDSEGEEKATPGRFYIKEAHFNWDFLSLKRGCKWDPVRRLCCYTIRLPKGLWRYPMDNWYVGLLSYQGQVALSQGSKRSLRLETPLGVK